MAYQSIGFSGFDKLDCAAPAPKVVASYGLGLDSSSLLLRWMEDPASRDFELSDLVLVTAMTGNEFGSTRASVERHMLPRLADHGVRFVQVARSQRKTTKGGGGVVVLDDSRMPQKLHIEGQFTLGQEMHSAGTLPQLGGTRKCSIHAKADCLEPVIARITKGQPYRHAMGFEVDERSRAAKDSLYNTSQRTGFYPLVEWGWDREACQRYVTELVGEPWQKSACNFCCFAMSSASGRAAVVERYRHEPQAGAYALFLERIAQSLNPRQTLIVGSSAAQLVASAHLSEVQSRFEAMLDATDFAVYEVRRLTRRARDTGRAFTARSIAVVAEGDRHAMDQRLAAMPGERITGVDAIVRHIVRERSASGPAVEHFYVSAPVGVEAKARPGFEEWWQEATGDALF